jgi:hypothetical protein
MYRQKRTLLVGCIGTILSFHPQGQSRLLINHKTIIAVITLLKHRWKAILLIDLENVV